MSAFSAAFTQFFSALTVLFNAFSGLATTVDNLATVASEASGAYKDQARIDRAVKLKALNAEHQLSITQ